MAQKLLVLASSIEITKGAQGTEELQVLTTASLHTALNVRIRTVVTYTEQTVQTYFNENAQSVRGAAMALPSDVERSHKILPVHLDRLAQLLTISPNRQNHA